MKEIGDGDFDDFNKNKPNINFSISLNEKV